MFGSKIDIHSGGEDLKFPHHENELAQSRSHFGCSQWVNYWLHTGWFCFFLINLAYCSHKCEVDENLLTFQFSIENFVVGAH